MRPQITARPVARSVADAARQLNEAEAALHAAHASHVDAWITAAADRLHESVEAYLRAVESTSH